MPDKMEWAEKNDKAGRGHIFAARGKKNEQPKSGLNGTRPNISLCRFFFVLFHSLLDGEAPKRNEISIRVYTCLSVTVAYLSLIGLPHNISMVPRRFRWRKTDTQFAVAKKYVFVSKKLREHFDPTERSEAFARRALELLIFSAQLARSYFRFRARFRLEEDKNYTLHAISSAKMEG